MKQPTKITEVTWPEMFGEATVLEIRAQVGQKLHPGDILLQAENDEATMELEIHDPSELVEIKVKPGQHISPNDVLAIIEAHEQSDRMGSDTWAKIEAHEQSDIVKTVIVVAVVGLAVALLIWLGVL